MTTHDEFATWDGAYLLGALSPADRRAYEEHLRTCETCSAAVSELAGLPGILGRVSEADAFALLEADQTPNTAGAGETSRASGSPNTSVPPRIMSVQTYCLRCSVRRGGVASGHACGPQDRSPRRP
ncbi:anti-sigma factor family protein [Leifsonia poae]|uniref:anti-sigma factor family protein n=1 Tax=Leifsonia poae TaxID=110933 RepID=UPI003D679DD4